MVKFSWIPPYDRYTHSELILKIMSFSNFTPFRWNIFKIRLDFFHMRFKIFFHYTFRFPNPVGYGYGSDVNCVRMRPSRRVLKLDLQGRSHKL